ncbi:MAG: AAA family ATPase [Vicinamibacterales bacterium]|nr:AAA family ATPase [Vicinamibacterales bacterium]
MSQNQKPPSFLDDPSCQAKFSELDRGLGDPDPMDDAALPPPKSARVVPANRVQAESPAPPASIFPESALAPGPASPPLSRFARAAARAAAQESADAATPASDDPRPLLDLFPPPPGRDRARGPAIAGAPPPRIVRSRFALQADSAPPPPAVPLTYEPFYGLSENPFSLSPDTKFVYHSTSLDRVLQELTDALGRGEPVMLLTGELGVGKTTLCRTLVEQLGRRTVTSLIAGPVASFEDLLRTVLVDFGVVAREDATRGRMAAATRQELIAAVGDFAASLAPLQASAVIILDEAQDVGPELLEPLSALSDVAGADRRVQIILVGQPALPALLHRKELRPLERQAAVRCRLDPLTAEETSGYVVHRLAVAGSNARVEFDEGAFAELHAATGGVPRLVNLVCDRALTRGQQMSASVIDDELVAAAAADLELVPLRFDARWIARMAVRAIVLLALMLAGAAAAAWVFRAQVSQFLSR